MTGEGALVEDVVEGNHSLIDDVSAKRMVLRELFPSLTEKLSNKIAVIVIEPEAPAVTLSTDFGILTHFRPRANMVQGND